MNWRTTNFTPIVAASFLISGCTHLLEIVDNQQIETEQMGAEISGRPDARIITIDGSRRLMRSSYIENGAWNICAETQADAIASRTSRADLEVTGRGAVEDSIEEALTITYNRTELSDTVRQLSWQVCNNRANGYLTNAEVEEALSELITGSMLVLQLRASVDMAAFEKAKKDLAEATAKLKAYSDCVTKADGDKAKIAACKA